MMTTIRFDYEYGELNEVSKREYEIKVDTNDPLAAMRQASVDLMSTKPSIGGPFRGVVLRVDTETVGFFRSVADFFSGDSPSWSAKVRIPELDSHLPVPSPDAPDQIPDTVSSRTDSDLKKYDTVSRHGTYFPRIEGMPKPNKGDIVWVDIINGQKFIIDTVAGAASSSSSNSNSSGGSGGSGRPGTPPTGSVVKGEHQPSPNTPEPVDQNKAIEFIRRVNAANRNRDPRKPPFTPIDESKWAEIIKFNIDTKEYNGQKLTLHADAFARYEDFREKFKNEYERIFSKSDVYPIFKTTEGFRLVFPGGGPHLSGLSTSQHGYGHSIDHEIQGGPLEARMNYVRFIIKIALDAGYTSFGVGNGVVHMDPRDSPKYWVYNFNRREDSGKVIDKYGSLSQLNIFKYAKYKGAVIPSEWMDNPSSYRNMVAAIQAWSPDSSTKIG